MLPDEAKWLGTVLSTVDPHSISPILNVGASTEKFRREIQPWINEFVIAPATRNGIRFIHADIKKDVGIDISGDLTDPHFLETLASLQLKSILCANLLEHVEDRMAICRALEGVLEPGGLLIVTVPYRYPYHPDPIDTGFRPTPEELFTFFPNCSIATSTILPCGTYLNRLLADRSLFAKTLLRLSVPFYRPRSWWNAARYLPWLFKQYRVTCVVFQRR